MKTVFIALFACWSTLALAQHGSLPALYDVAGVTAEDVLNIRQAPEVSSPIIGKLDPDATGIEVVGLDPASRWALINTGEQSGYAALAYLSRQSASPAPQLAKVTQCFGTEPFWSISVDQSSGGMTGHWSTPDETTSLSIAIGPPSLSNRHRFALTASALGQNGLTRALIGTIRREACNDGMSDRAYALGIDVLSKDGGSGSVLYSGCCSIAP